MKHENEMNIAEARTALPFFVKLAMRYREDLKFYTGKTREAQWDGPKLLTFDKYGGLCEEISGSFVADAALALTRGGDNV